MWHAPSVRYFYTLDKLYLMCNHTSAIISAIVSEILEGPTLFFYSFFHGS